MRNQSVDSVISLTFLILLIINAITWLIYVGHVGGWKSGHCHVNSTSVVKIDDHRDEDYRAFWLISWSKNQPDQIHTGQKLMGKIPVLNGDETKTLGVVKNMLSQYQVNKTYDCYASTTRNTDQLELMWKRKFQDRKRIPFILGTISMSLFGLFLLATCILVIFRR